LTVKIITFHSYKGGTGKTTLATNLAYVYALKGKSVCLLDLDLRAPSLQDIFKGRRGNSLWINNFLNGDCKLEEVLLDESVGEGRVFVGLADPSTKAIREALAKSRKEEMEALQRLAKAKEILSKMKVDYTILDTSPGIQYSSLNSILVSNITVLTLTPDESDMFGCQRMLNEIYDLLEKKAVILMNKVPSEFFTSEEKSRLINQLNQMFGKELIAIIPCFCDVSWFGRKIIFSKEKPEHSLTKILGEVAEKLDYFLS